MKIKTLGLWLLIGSIVGCTSAEDKDPVKPSGRSADIFLSQHGELRVIAIPDYDSSPPRVDYVLKDKQGKAVYRFPDFHVNGKYAYYETRDISLGDVNHDGRKDVAIIAEFMTGIGPSGAEPFGVAGLYLQTGNGFERAVELEELLNGDRYYGIWKSAADLVAIAASHTQ